MTRFNPDADLVPIEQWEEIAEARAMETGATWRIIGGIIAGGVGFAASIPALGIVVGSYLCYTAYERFVSSSKDLRAVRDFGCIAHLLDEQEFRSFNKQFGDKEVYNQITFAIDRGWSVSKFAQSWLNSYERGQHLQPAWKQNITPIESHHSQSIGTDYGNISRASSATNQTVIETYNPLTSSQIDIVREMTDRIQNIFGVGQGGSGKGMLLANACRAVRAKHPNKKIFLINGKDDPKEHDYFTGIVDVEKRLHCETAKPSTVAAWFEASIAEYDDFAAQNNGALLVIDESTIIGARLKDAKSNALNDKVIGITSCGGSMGKNIWVFVQTPFAGGSGSTLSAISQMISIVLVRGDAIGVLEQWKRSALFRKFDASEVAELANHSNCNRAVYWGGSANWYSMPKLTNYSTYDRDTGTFIKDVLTPVEQLEKMLISEQPTKVQNELSNQVDPKLLDCIIDKIASTDSYISFEGIRSHVRRTMPDFAKTDLIEAALTNLIDAQIIQGNRETGYRST